PHAAAATPRGRRSVTTRRSSDLIAQQCGRSDDRGRLEPAFARSKTESRDRGSLDARDPLAIECDPGVSGAIATSGAQCFSASTRDRKSTRLNSSHEWISYAVFCL